MNQNHRPPQEKVCGYEYTVRRGDSFYLIANRLGIPLRDLLEANSDINPARLMVGDVLCIPMEEDDAPPEQESPIQPEPPTEPEPPVIPEEDTPEEVLPEEPLPEENLDVPAVDEGMAVCPESNRYTLRQGESATDIQLRENLNRYTLQSANPEADLDALGSGQTLCIPDENRPCPVRMTYVLQPDETLESVALKLNASLASLLRENPCLAPSDFTLGQCIYIP